MSEKFTKPSLENLVVEQEAVQFEKFQGRLLFDYNAIIVPGKHWKEPRSSAVTDLLRSYCQDDRVSLESIIDGMCTQNPDKIVHWVDMGGGRGLAMREFASSSSVSSRVHMTNVDLFDFGVEGLTQDELDYLNSDFHDILNENTKPEYIFADCETVQLNRHPELITCNEAVQYLDNPLGSICNWYNQLADGGIMIIGNESEWASWLRYEKGSYLAMENYYPTEGLLEALQGADIPHAASEESDFPGGYRPKTDPSHFSILAIQKKAGTKLSLRAEVQEIWENPHGYKAVYYSLPKGENADALCVTVEVA